MQLIAEHKLYKPSNQAFKVLEGWQRCLRYLVWFFSYFSTPLWLDSGAVKCKKKTKNCATQSFYREKQCQPTPSTDIQVTTLPWKTSMAVGLISGEQYCNAFFYCITKPQRCHKVELASLCSLPVMCVTNQTSHLSFHPDTVSNPSLWNMCCLEV